MDPSMYLQYNPGGLPQESKLVTYMSQTPATQQNLSHAMGALNLDSSPVPVRKPITIGDYIPPTYFNPNLMSESPGSSPPSVINQNASTSQVHLVTDIKIHQLLTSNRVALLGGQIKPVPAIKPSAYKAKYIEENVGGTTYFYPTNPDINTTAPLNNTAQGLAATFYMPETIRSELLQKNEELYMQLNVQQYRDLPETVEHYTELIPLEEPMPGALISTFRVTHNQFGQHFAMKRLHAYGGNNGKRHIEIWKNIDHPNIVRLHEVFTTKDFGDHSLVFIYDYHGNVKTLMVKYLSNNNQNISESAAFVDPFSSDPDAPRPYTHQKNAMLRAVACGALLPEAELWSLIIQLTAALRLIHSKGLACRSLNPTKVIMDGCRARISWCGTAEALLPASVTDSASEIAQAQQEDLISLGRLALSLACRSLHAPSRDNLQASIDLVSRTYSADFKNLILYLLTSSGSHRRSVNDLMPMIGARFYTQVEALERRTSAIEHQLSRELDNARLFRVLIKLGAINERPELNMDGSWSETGDRYLLKLFRDYLFHAVTSEGKPWLDQSHVVHCLNHLDAGSQNYVQLISRDEQSVLLVSFSELKHCLEQSFEEIMSVAVPATGTTT